MKTILQFTMVFLIFLQTNLFAQKDYALVFNGIDQRVKYSSDATLDIMNGATDYTIEAWVKPLSTDINNNVVIKRWYQFAITLYKDDAKRLYFTHYGTPDNFSQQSTFINSIDNAITLDAWNHIVVINDSAKNEIKMYVNGVDVTLQHYDALPLISNPDEGHDTYAPNLYIANGGSGTYLDAAIDKVRVIKEALDINTLQKTINDPNYTTNANTSVLFYFDEGAGDVTKNEASGANVDLLGAPSWVELEGTASLAKNNTTTFNIYPNPSIEKMFVIEANNNETLKKVEIFDILGKSVKVMNLNNNAITTRIDNRNLKSGVYFLKITTDAGIGTKKIIVR